MSRKGSAGNVLAALISLFIPGLGQICQGRILRGVFYFFTSLALWVVFFGWVIAIISCIDAAIYEEE